MYVPVDAPAAARATIAPAASRPWRLVELGLVDLPDTARARKECERHRAADLQQFGWPNDRHANCAAGCAFIARTAAAEARGSEAVIGPALKVDQLSCAVATRAVDVQLKAVPGDVANGLKWKRAKHGANRNASASRESLSQQ
jgi:hypothetical protein